MNAAAYPEVLRMVKFDLGISTDKRDDYLMSVIEGCDVEILRKGIILDGSNADDLLLLNDYVCYTYRHRTENVPLSENLRLRLVNRRVRRAANAHTTE